MIRKYMLARGQGRLPISGSRLVPRPGKRPKRYAETVLFTPGQIVESDLDFGPWLKDGVIVQVDPPLPPGGAPIPAPPPPTVLSPMPPAVVVEAVVERTPPPPDRPVMKAEEHLSTNPKPLATPEGDAPVVDFPPPPPPVVDEVDDLESDVPDQETEEDHTEEEAAVAPVAAPAAKGPRGRGRRR